MSLANDKDINKFINGELREYKFCTKKKTIDVVARNAYYSIECKKRDGSSHNFIEISQTAYEKFNHQLIDNKGYVHFDD
jgi:hypothetical protein